MSAHVIFGGYSREIDRLVGGYNFPDRWYADVFVDLLETAIEERASPTVLDIGCGQGIFHDRRYQERLRSHVGHFVGVEPDAAVILNEGLFDELHCAAMEDARIAPGSIDIAYAAMVAEHVAEPSQFLQAVARALRPGGSLLLCTPNARSYFGRICSVVRRAGIEDWLLRKVIGAESADGYHYPTTYRMNTEGQLQALAYEAGLEARIGYTEAGIACRRYFPGPLRPFWSLSKLKRKAWKNPRALTHIIAVLDKPA